MKQKECIPGISESVVNGDVLLAVPLALMGKESVKICKRVDFPAPEGPKIAVMLPSGNCRSILCKIVFPLLVETDLTLANP